MPDDHFDPEPDGEGQPQSGGGWISGPMNGGPDDVARERWPAMNSGGHWPDSAEPVEEDGSAES